MDRDPLDEVLDACELEDAATREAHDPVDVLSDEEVTAELAKLRRSRAQLTTYSEVYGAGPAAVRRARDAECNERRH
jgi:hypothetical protein